MMGIRSSRCQRPSILKSPARSCNRTLALDDDVRGLLTAMRDRTKVTQAGKNWLTEVGDRHDRFKPRGLIHDFGRLRLG